MPHTTKGIVHVLHDLRRRFSPSQLEEFLPDVTRVSMNDGVGNASQEFMNHDGFVVLGDRIESLLNYVAAKRIHR